MRKTAKKERHRVMTHAGKTEYEHTLFSVRTDSTPLCTYLVLVGNGRLRGNKDVLPWGVGIHERSGSLQSLNFR